MKKIIILILIVLISLFTIIWADPAPGDNQTFSLTPRVEVKVDKNLSN